MNSPKPLLSGIFNFWSTSSTPLVWIGLYKVAKAKGTTFMKHINFNDVPFIPVFNIVMAIKFIIGNWRKIKGMTEEICYVVDYPLDLEEEGDKEEGGDEEYINFLHILAQNNVEKDKEFMTIIEIFNVDLVLLEETLKHIRSLDTSNETDRNIYSKIFKSLSTSILEVLENMNMNMDMIEQNREETENE